MKAIVYLFFLMITVCGSCISDIDFDVPGSVQDAVVIQAKVTKGDPSIVDVQVINAFDFTGLSPTIRVSDAVLTNITSGQSISLPTTEFNARGASIPEGDPSMDVNYTDEYTLSVRTIGGQTFTSTPERLYAVPTPENITYKAAVIETVTIGGNSTFDDVIRYSISTPTRNNFGEYTRMRWAFEQVYTVTDMPIRQNVEPKTCYLTQSFGAAAEVSYDPSILEVERINDFEVLEAPLIGTYAEGSYFQITQQSLSEGAFQYFQEIQGLLGREGSIFDPPAGQIRTNFVAENDATTDVFGYFYMTEESITRIFVDPEDFDNISPICPPNSMRPAACPVALCCDCLDAEESTVERPTWWD